MFRSTLYRLPGLLIAIALLALTGIVSAQDAPPALCRDALGTIVPCPPPPGGACFDAAGAVIPCPPPVEPPTAIPPTLGPDTDGDGVPDSDDRCPTAFGAANIGRGDCPDPDGDFITNDGDLCPDQPGPAETGGCPPATATPLPTTPPQPTIAPVQPVPATLVLPEDGSCVITPLDQALVPVFVDYRDPGVTDGALEFGVAYEVAAVHIRDGVLWVRKAPASGDGYVRYDEVRFGGRCAFGDFELTANAATVDLTPYLDYAAGTVDPDRCVQWVNGQQVCDLELVITNADGSTEGKFCKGLWGKLACMAAEYVAENFCEIFTCPGPNQGGYDDPTPDDSEPGDGDAGTGNAGQDGIGDGQVYCEDLIGSLTAAAFDPALPQSPLVTTFGTEGVQVLLPAIQYPIIHSGPRPRPTPSSTSGAPAEDDCVLEVDLVRVDQAVDGIAPIDRLRVVLTSWPPPGVEVLELVGMGDGYETLLGSLVIDLASGEACIPAMHGDFAACPDPTGAHDYLLDIPLTPGEMGEQIQLIDALISLPEPGNDPTEYSCFAPGNGFVTCVCQGFDDCFDLATNACAGPDASEMICNGGNCACGFPETLD